MRSWAGGALFLPSAVVLFGLVGCRGRASGPGKGLGRIRLATTTSTENSGLLAELLPAFEKRFGARVEVIAVGTGKALELGRRGDVDLVMVHDRARELPFVKHGYGVNRVEFMYNDFVLLGPKSDPAGAGKAPDVLSALRAVAASDSTYLSRDDGSGTHARDALLRKRAGVEMKHHIRAGVGMAQALRMASEKRAYVLSDRGTYLALQERLHLVIVSSGDSILQNVYSVIPVNPFRHRGVAYEAAMTLVGYLTGPDGQERIAAFRKKQTQLFHPILLSGFATERP